MLALDVSIQSQVLNLLADLQQEFGLTYLFIAHNLAVVQHISDRVGVMYLGKIVEMADVRDLYRQARHPYSVALLSAVPERTRADASGGWSSRVTSLPSPVAPPPGCRFHTRCWLREQLGDPERCEVEEPELRDVGGGHMSACHYAEDVEEQSIAEAAAAAAQELIENRYCRGRRRGHPGAGDASATSHRVAPAQGSSWLTTR